MRILRELIRACEDNGINFFDCWMSEPDVRSHLGRAIKDNRENWVIQGHMVQLGKINSM